MKSPQAEKRELVDSSSLHPWDKNPKYITANDLVRLQENLTRFGQIRPLVINNGESWGEAGTILGGNSTFQALLNNNETKIWVTFVAPKNEEEAIAIALSDNEQYGRYDAMKLSTLLAPYKGSFLDQYKVQLSDAPSIATLIGAYAPTPTQSAPQGASGEPTEQEPERDVKPPQDLNAYMGAAIKQIVLFFPAQEYRSVIEEIEDIMATEDLQNATQVFQHLLKAYRGEV